MIRCQAPQRRGSSLVGAFSYRLRPQEFFSAYERIFLDLLEGNTTLFVRGDEAEESWRVVEPILQAWDQELVPLLEYPAGSDGPSPETLDEPAVRSPAPGQGIG